MGLSVGAATPGTRPEQPRRGQRSVEKVRRATEGCRALATTTTGAAGGASRWHGADQSAGRPVGAPTGMRDARGEAMQAGAQPGRRGLPSRLGQRPRTHGGSNHGAA